MNTTSRGEEVASEWAAGIGGHRSRAEPRRPKRDSGELLQLVRELVAAGAPGAAARIEDERGVEQVANGVADLRTGRAMQPHLHFRAGSVTKPFVATVVLQLVADGKLSLSDSVDRWLPGVLSYGDQINIRQLLNHTSGVPHNAPMLWRSLYGSPDGRFRTWTPRAQIALVADLPPLFPAGTAWAYTNVGYTLLGLIIEAATGTRLGTQLSRRIFRPLGLRDTSFPVAGTGIPSPMSRGYSLPLSPQLDVVDRPADRFHGPEPLVCLGSGRAHLESPGSPALLSGPPRWRATAVPAAIRDADQRRSPTCLPPVAPV